MDLSTQKLQLTWTASFAIRQPDKQRVKKSKKLVVLFSGLISFSLCTAPKRLISKFKLKKLILDFLTIQFAQTQLPKNVLLSFTFAMLFVSALYLEHFLSIKLFVIANQWNFYTKIAQIFLAFILGSLMLNQIALTDEPDHNFELSIWPESETQSWENFKVLKVEVHEPESVEWLLYLIYQSFVFKRSKFDWKISNHSNRKTYCFILINFKLTSFRALIGRTV